MPSWARTDAARVAMSSRESEIFTERSVTAVQPTGSAILTMSLARSAHERVLGVAGIRRLLVDGVPWLRGTGRWFTETCLSARAAGSRARARRAKLARGASPSPLRCALAGEAGL